MNYMCVKCGADAHTKFIGQWLCTEHGRELLRARREERNSVNILKIPTYFDLELVFIEQEGKYYMYSAEFDTRRREISKSFYDAALIEIATNNSEWERMV